MKFSRVQMENTIFNLKNLFFFITTKIHFHPFEGKIELKLKRTFKSLRNSKSSSAEKSINLARISISVRQKKILIIHTHTFKTSSWDEWDGKSVNYSFPVHGAGEKWQEINVSMIIIIFYSSFVSLSFQFYCTNMKSM